MVEVYCAECGAAVRASTNQKAKEWSEAHKKMRHSKDAPKPTKQKGKRRRPKVPTYKLDQTVS